MIVDDSASEPGHSGTACKGIRSFRDALQPHALTPGSHVNDTADLSDRRWVRASYGSKDDRLARIKAAYDPDNVFKHNANIQPASP